MSDQQENGHAALSAKTFEYIMARYREHYEQDAELRDIVNTLAGSEANARAFLEPPGVGIGEFSRMLDLPVSTVRHYVRLGLVEPWEVNGRLRFEAVNVAQVRVVRHWIELGLTLEHIRSRQQAQQAAVPGLLVQGVLSERIGFVRRTVHRPGEQPSFSDETHVFDATITDEHDTEAFKARSVIASLREAYRQARERLEAKKLELDARIEHAREMEAVLSG